MLATVSGSRFWSDDVAQIIQGRRGRHQLYLPKSHCARPGGVAGTVAVPPEGPEPPAKRKASKKHGFEKQIRKASTDEDPPIWDRNKSACAQILEVF